VYWVTENPNVTEQHALNLPRTSVWSGHVFQKDVTAIFLDASVRGTAYLTML
jgi:hypothetical protein